MIRETLLKQIFVLIVCIVVLHFSALVFYLYWSIWWYDEVVHYLGGVWIALASLWLFFFSGYVHLKANRSAQILAMVVIFALTIGVLWELFEFLFGESFIVSNYEIDTLSDLLMDIAGGLSGYLYFVFRKYEKILIENN
ncbi:MAG: hypothetical protein ABI430_01325 [Candidatus Taylorbacteria bacterium]